MRRKHEKQSDLPSVRHQMTDMGIGPMSLAPQNTVLSSPPFCFLEVGC